mmetsp:Transcript_46368/g.115362  ORF Transcript_46368/g.115362 Transcript_46368/m.115362 type:complete len:121 (-) Transcript_46368:1566-1928(-)
MPAGTPHHTTPKRGEGEREEEKTELTAFVTHAAHGTPPNCTPTQTTARSLSLFLSPSLSAHYHSCTRDRSLGETKPVSQGKKARKDYTQESKPGRQQASGEQEPGQKCNQPTSQHNQPTD